MGSIVNTISSSRRPKNLLYNGAFSITQRGTSYSGTANAFAYTADRWGFFPGNVSNYTIQRVAHSNTNYASGEYRHGYRIQRNSGNTAVTGYQFNQTLERNESQLLIGKTLTLSFNAYRGANFSASGNILNAVIAYTLLNGDTNYIQGWTTPLTAGSSAIALTTTSTRYSLTATLPNLAIVGVAVNFYYFTSGTAGAADHFTLEDVMLEEGGSATEFETRGKGIAQELALCQRYYEKSYDLSAPPGTLTQVGAHSSQPIGVGNRPFTTAYFKVEKRTTPLRTLWSPQNGTSGVSNVIWDSQTASTHYSVAADGVSTKSYWVTPTGTPPAAGSLFFHWTMDAEL